MDDPKWLKLLSDVIEEYSLTATLAETLKAKFPRPSCIVYDHVLRKPGKLTEKGLKKDGLASRLTALYAKCEFLTDERYKAKALGRYLNRRYEQDPDSIYPRQDSIEPTPTNQNPTTAPIPQRQLFGATQIRDIPDWVGRDKLLTELHADFAKGRKMLVLFGQGGIGKTSLAVKLMAGCIRDKLRQLERCQEGTENMSNS